MRKPVWCLAVAICLVAGQTRGQRPLRAVDGLGRPVRPQQTNIKSPIKLISAEKSRDTDGRDIINVTLQNIGSKPIIEVHFEPRYMNKNGYPVGAAPSGQPESPHLRGLNLREDLTPGAPTRGSKKAAAMMAREQAEWWEVDQRCKELGLHFRRTIAPRETITHTIILNARKDASEVFYFLTYVRFDHNSVIVAKVRPGTPYISAKLTAEPAR